MGGFSNLRQENQATLLLFANRLRNKAMPCDFPDHILENNFCALFVGGVSSGMTKQLLYAHELKMYDMTLNAAIESKAVSETPKTTS